MAIGIPIKMVVLTIVGMAGLASMIVIIQNGDNAMPEPLHAYVISGNIIVLSDFNDTYNINMTVRVIDSVDGASIGKASVVLSGMGTAAVNITNNEGYSILRFNKTDFDQKDIEGYLRLDVKASGFQDYSNEYAVKIVI